MFIYLSYLNNVSGNFNLAINYGKKALQLAKEQDNHQWIGADYLQISSSYYHKNMRDSSNHYIDCLLPYVDDQPRQELPDMLNNIAVSYLDRDNIATAKQYLNRSLEIRPMAHTYYLLSLIYSTEGRIDEAERLWQRALQGENLYLRSKISRMYAEWLREQGQHQRASEMTVVAEILEDSISKKQMGEKALTAQSTYDHGQLSARLKKWAWRVVIVVCVLGGVLILVFRFYYKRKAHQARQQAKQLDDAVQKSRQKIAKLEDEASIQTRQTHDLQLLVREKSRQLRQVSIDHERKDHELTSLRLRVNTMKERQEQLMTRGKTRYLELFGGDGNAKQWNKDAAQDFLTYFSAVHPDKTEAIHKTYQSLSPRQEIMAILIQDGYTDNQLKRVLGLSDGALRTAKARLKACRR